MTLHSEYAGGWARTVDVVSSRHFVPALALVLTALVVLATVLYTTARVSAFGTSATVEAPVAASISQPIAAPRTGKKNSTQARVDNVEALVGAVAKKYRVSHYAVRDFIEAAFTEAKRNRIDPLLVIAVIAIESRFNPVAQSDQGATGLMQIIPRYHADKFSAASGETVLDPRTNIKVGAQVLKEYIARGGNEAAGLQLYNGSSDAENAYAVKVMAERQRLLDTMRRGRTGKSVGMLALS